LASTVANDDLMQPLREIVTWARLLLSEEVDPLNDAQREHVEGILTSVSRELDNVCELSALIARMRAGLEFVNISFETRTPINGVIGYSKILLDCPELYDDAPLTEAQRGYLQAIYNAGRGVLSLLNDIFDYARLQTGIAYSQRDWFDLADVLWPLVERYQMQSDIHQDDLPQVYADEYRSRQLFANLAANLCSVLSDGVLEMTVFPGVENIEVSLALRDDALPALDADPLFDPAVGLSLPIAKGLAELQGGGLRVESAPGHLAFTVMIPIQPAD